MGCPGGQGRAPTSSHPTLLKAGLGEAEARGWALGPLALSRGHLCPDLCLCLPRKPALPCTVCSGNLLICCKSLWGLGFLQRHMRGPSEEQPGEPLSEEPLRTPPQEAVRTLPSEAV